MPEQKLTSAEKLVTEFDRIIDDTPNKVLSKKAMAKWIRERIQNETLETAAQTVEAIDLKYLTRAKAASDIRRLIQKEGEPDAEEK